MTGEAKRVTVHVAHAAPSHDLAQASLAIPEALAKQPVAPGAEVTIVGVPFLVASLLPAGASDITERTEIVVHARPRPTPTRPVFDALVLIDASWSMGKPIGSQGGAPGRSTRFEAALEAASAFIGQSGDIVRKGALATFTREFNLESNFEPPASLDAHRLSGLVPRGRGDLEEALNGALSAFAEASEPSNRTAILVATDAGGDLRAMESAGRRARRLDARIDVLDLGETRSESLAALAMAAGGVHAHGASFGPAFESMARAIGSPARWLEPPSQSHDGD